MVRSELIAALVADGLDPSIAEASVKSLFEAIAAHLEKGGRVEVRGFGSFSPRTYAERPRIHPGTRETVGASPARRIHFKPGRPLAAMLARTGIK